MTDLKMIKDIVTEVVFKLFGKFWAWLITKIYPKEEFQKDIEVDVRSTNPCVFNVNSEIPTVFLYLKIINKSRFKITFDALFDIWIKSSRGYEPFVHQGTFHPQKIEKKETKEIYWKKELNEHQTKALKTIKESSNDILMTVYVNYHIHSTIYEINKKISLENKSCKIE